MVKPEEDRGKSSPLALLLRPYGDLPHRIETAYPEGHIVLLRGDRVVAERPTTRSVWPRDGPATTPILVVRQRAIVFR